GGSRLTREGFVGGPRAFRGGAPGGHLSQRQVLRKPGCRKTFRGTRQQREKRSSRGMGARGAAAEPGGNAGSAQSVFEHGLVTLRTAQQDGDPIERGPFPRELQNAAYDLDALQAFSGSGEDFEAAVGVRVCRRLG